MSKVIEVTDQNFEEEVLKSDLPRRSTSGHLGVVHVLWFRLYMTNFQRNIRTLNFAKLMWMKTLRRRGNMGL